LLTTAYGPSDQKMTLTCGGDGRAPTFTRLISFSAALGAIVVSAEQTISSSAAVADGSLLLQYLQPPYYYLARSP
jgi:hypothetical protein